MDRTDGSGTEGDGVDGLANEVQRLEQDYRDMHREYCDAMTQLDRVASERWELLEALKYLLGDCDNIGPDCRNALEASRRHAYDTITRVGGWPRD